MKKFNILIIFLSISIFLASCSEDKKTYDGFYETTKFEIQENSCTGEFSESVNDEYKFLKIGNDSSFNEDFIFLCGNSNPDSCSSKRESLNGYYKLDLKNATICVLNRIDFEISSVSDGIVIKKIYKKLEFPEVPLDSCNLNLLTGNEKNWNCEKIYRISAKKL